MIAKSSGMTVGTSARNSTIRITKAASNPMMSLRPCVGGALSASPVNSTWMPAGSAIDRSWSSAATTPERGSSKPVLSYCTSKYATRPFAASCFESGASGLVIATTSVGFSASCFWDAAPAASILRRTAAFAVLSSRCPSLAASTTRRAAPFSPPNFAVIRSVAFCVSEPGILKSLISLPWKAAFSPIRATKTTSQVETTRHGCRAQCPANRARMPVCAMRCSSGTTVYLPIPCVCRLPGPCKEPRRLRTAELIGTRFLALADERQGHHFSGLLALREPERWDGCAA